MFYDLFRHISTFSKLTQAKPTIIQYPIFNNNNNNKNNNNNNNNNNKQIDIIKELKLTPIFQNKDPKIMVKYNPDNRHIISFIMGIGVGVGVGFGIGIGLVRYGGKPIYKW